MSDGTPAKGGPKPPTGTIILGLTAAALVLAGLFFLGRIGGGSTSQTTLQELDPGMAAFESDLQRLLDQVEGWAEGPAAIPTTPAQE